MDFSFELLAPSHDLYSSWCKNLQGTEVLDHCASSCRTILGYTADRLPSYLIDRFHLFGKVMCSMAAIEPSLEKLDQGIEYLHSALTADSHSPLSHPPIELILSDLASALHVRWDLTEELADLQLSIDIRRLALSQSHPFSHRNHLASITTLSTVLFVRFAHFPRLSDLDEALGLGEQALALCPRYDKSTLIDRFGCLCTQGQSLLVRWDYDGNDDHIHRAITHLREAVDLGRMLAGPLDCALALNALSEAIQGQRLISDAEMEECVSLDREALDLVPRDHPERLLTLAAMATTILVRYTILEESSDWESYQDLHGELATLVNADEHRYSGFYRSSWDQFLSIRHYSGRYALTSIFRQALYIKMAEDDWKSARPLLRRRIVPHIFLRRLIDPVGSEVYITSIRIQLRQIPTHEVDQRRSIIGHIAWMCRGKLFRPQMKPPPISFEETKKTWLKNMPPNDHPLAIGHYIGIGDECQDMFYNLLDANKLVDALEMLQQSSIYALQALELYMMHGHFLTYQQMSRLALTYITRAETEFDHGIDTPVSVVEDAVKYSMTAVESTPPGFPSEIRNLADAHLIKYKLWKDESDLKSAIGFLRQGSYDRTQVPDIRYALADRWADVAEELDHECRREAYIARIDTLHEVVTNMFNLVELTDNIDVLGGPDFLASATEYCIIQGAYDDMMYLLGKGRGMLWASLLRLQYHRIQGLVSQNSDKAAKLRMMLEAAEMEREIQHSSTIRLNLKLDPQDKERTPALNNSYRHYRLDFDIGRLTNNALEQSDRGPDIDTPMVWRPFAESIPADIFPIVVFNAGVERCDALVIRGKDYAIQHVPLPECDRAQLNSLVKKLESILGASGALVRGASPKKKGAKRESIEDILAIVWGRIVEPVVKMLGLKPTDKPARLWWYPTGPFWQLPLHAAGKYSGVGSISIQDYVVSSYLPTFNISGSASMHRKTKTNILAVYQTKTPGYPPLPEVAAEVRDIKQVVEGKHNVTFASLGESDASLSAIRSALPAATIVHFALHGQQNHSDPLESSLILSDAKNSLRLSQLVEMHLPNADLAFLSACETATGHKILPEEVIHIAATMLFVGFKRAIGTMWSINDCDGPPIARETYRSLLDSGKVEYMDAAHALHLSVKKLRTQNVPAIRWAPFLHIGL